MDLRSNEETIKKLKEHGKAPIQYQEGLNLKKIIDADDYVECSSKSMEGLKEVFDAAIRAAMNKGKKESTKKSFCSAI